MRDLLAASSGAFLTAEEWMTEFDKNFWNITAPGFWKLERQQTFAEPYDSSWAAFARGEWHQAMELLQARRAELDKYYEKVRACGFDTWRVRVVEKPITPYLQWELRLLRLRAEKGAKIRVISPGQIKEYETHHQLPELTILGTDVMYEVLYNEEGVYKGAMRFSEPGLIAQCQKFIEGLYDIGEDIEPFFNREVANLVPPAGKQSTISA